jgi:hypothetical protein
MSNLIFSCRACNNNSASSNPHIHLIPGDPPVAALPTSRQRIHDRFYGAGDSVYSRVEGSIEQKQVDC